MDTKDISEDQTYSSVFTTLFKLFKENKKDELKRQTQHFLSVAKDPYHMTMACIRECPGLFISKSNTFVARLLAQLENFIGADNNINVFKHCLTESIQIEAYKIAMQQKNTGVTRLFVKCFLLKKLSEFLLPLLRNEIESNLKKVCLMATLLGLQSHFSASELIMPLYFANELPLADEFVMSSASHQKDFLLLLDGLLEDSDKSCFEDEKATNAKNMRDPKVVCDTIGKLLKRFGLSSSLCPNFKKYRAIGGLRFMFYKNYTAKDMLQSAFYSLIDDTLKEYPDVIYDLLQLFVRYNDLHHAVYYVVKFKVSDKDIPYAVKDHMEIYPELLHVAQHQVNEGELPQDEADEVIKKCYSLTLSNEDIILVDSIAKFEECVPHLRATPVLSVDAEWKPSFGVSQVEEIALLQFATTNKVYLLDLIAIQSLLQDCHWQSIAELFPNPEIYKLGYGIKNDNRILANLHPEMKKGVQNSKSIIDLDARKEVLLGRYPNIFSHSGEKHKGLSDMVYRCFGYPLDKREAFSNWAARPLNKSQIAYATLDVRCLIDIYNYLNERSKELGISDWINMKKQIHTEVKRAMPTTKEETDDERSQLIRHPIAATKFKVICDAMLQGLAKRLRSCGVDAATLETGEASDRCYWYFEKEKRVILTRGNNYLMLRKHAPEEFVYHVKSETSHDQLAEVIEMFKVKVTLSDVFARCSKCNSESYIVVPSSVISAMQSGTTNSNDTWVEYEGGSINILSGLTSNGVQVQFKSVPKPVVEEKDTFYICSECGWCYWVGSHLPKILEGRLKDIVSDDGASNFESPEIVVT